MSSQNIIEYPLSHIVTLRKADSTRVRISDAMAGKELFELAVALGDHQATYVESCESLVEFGSLRRNAIFGLPGNTRNLGLRRAMKQGSTYVVTHDRKTWRLF